MPENEKLSHLIIEGPSETHNFTNRKQMGASSRIPTRNRVLHSQFIQRRLEEAWNNSESNTVSSHTANSGIYLEFKGKAGFDLATKSLENMRSKKIRLCNIRNEIEPVENANGTPEQQKVVYATVYVPNDQRRFFMDKVQKYAEEYNIKKIKRSKIFPQYDEYKNTIEPLFENIDESTLKVRSEISNDQIMNLSNLGIPDELVETLKKTPKNSELVNGIEDVKKAVAESFWVDSPDLFPIRNREWCEVWLRGDSDEIEREFIARASEIELTIKPGRIKFPERIVKIIHANGEELNMLQSVFPWIAEYRRAKETATFWIEQSNRDQFAWTEDILNRIEIDTDSITAICILDTGINNGHPLINLILNDEDRHSINQSWGTHDHDNHGHGTSMAGLAGFGDIQNILESNDRFAILHLLESSKILPPPPQSNDPDLWGDFTKQGVSNAEIQAPDRKRIICMAVTATDTRDQGNPSSWSGAIDQMTSGAEDEKKRLVILSAGNYTCEFTDLSNYPEVQITDSIHDPAQSWNAVSVGAYTNLTTITDPSLEGFSPLAQAGEISPFTTTSFVWKNKWPVKPEVVFEGGNIAINENSTFLTTCDDLSLLTTNFEPHNMLFSSFCMTSAATAQAAHFAAKIQIQYPNYWPETIRGLMIHSSEWTEAMKAQFPEENENIKVSKLLKAVGYGVPNLEKALYCAGNSLTLISQSEIQPYEEILDNNGQKKRKTKDMHFYELPWPNEVLESLENTEVEMRVTLSYFIEPGPGQVGWKDRYRYPSHLLRFDINSPTESQEEFLKRVNAAMQDEENYQSTQSPSSHWVIGMQNRDKGSIHSDIWRGTALELSASNLIAVSPRLGWWKERSHLGKINSNTRYSLIISIHTPEQDVDLYTPVATSISTPISIQTSID